MKIIIQRDSVCMGDDCEAPHEKILEVPFDMTYQKLHERLKQENYFPSVSGNNVVWVLTTPECWDIYSYFTRTGEIAPNVEEERLSTLCPEGKFYFKYYSSTLEWQKKILEYFHGNQRYVYQEGWMKEYLYCQELMKEECPAHSIFETELPF